MGSRIDSFRAGWSHVRGLTFDFIEAVPEDRWEFSPHPRFAPLNKQLRHVVCVQGVYIGGVQTRRANFAQKHSHYAGGLDRESLVAALGQKDRELDCALDAVPDEASYVIDFYGQQTLESYLAVIRHHEAIHHGQWSLYAALGGFETPESWKLNWGL